MLRGEWKSSCSDQTYRMDLSLLNCCFWSSPLTTPAPNFHLFHVRMMPAFEHIGDTACLCCTFYKNLMIFYYKSFHPVLILLSISHCLLRKKKLITKYFSPFPPSSYLPSSTIPRVIPSLTCKHAVLLSSHISHN